MNDRQALRDAVRFRRLIHRHPELGGREFKTTALVSRVLADAKIPHRRLKPTGVVARMASSEKGPCLAFRADMDALPLTERSGLSFRSQTPGVMHACGHDAHTAMLLSAAVHLQRQGGPVAGALTFLFQPDEEGSGGARRLIDQGVMKRPTVDAVFGVHVNPRLPAGTLGVKAGPLMAAVDRFTLTISGEGGHGAYPHEGKDAVVIAAQVVTALQSIVSRRVDPVEPVVLTVGTIHGGDRFNILPESVTLTGTVRTLSHRTHREIPRLIRQTADNVARAYGGRAALSYEVLGQPVINDAAMAALARRAAVDAVGERRVVDLDRPSMGGEDFSEYLAQAPGCFVYVGTGAGPATRRPWHHPSFVLHEPSMLSGIRFFDALARRGLSELAKR